MKGNRTYAPLRQADGLPGGFSFAPPQSDKFAIAAVIPYNKAMALHAIITAGGGVPADLKAHVDGSRKALIDLNGMTLLSAATSAAGGCRHVNRIVAVGNPEVAAALGDAAEFISEGETVIDNIFRAFEHLGGADHDYLVLSPDLPFVASAQLDSFLTAATNMSEIAAPVISREDFLGAFPGAKNKFLPLAGGHEVTMGSCFFFTGQALKANFPLGRDCYRNRKFPHRLAIMLGLPIVFALLFKRLTLEMIEQRASQLTGARVKAISGQEAGLAYDVDNLENYEYARRLLAQPPAG